MGPASPTLAVPHYPDSTRVALRFRRDERLLRRCAAVDEIRDQEETLDVGAGAEALPACLQQERLANVAEGGLHGLAPRVQDGARHGRQVPRLLEGLLARAVRA